MTNTVNPDYYNKYSATVGNITVHPIDLTVDTEFDLGNVFKYLLRYQDKGQIEDLKKAFTYLEHYEKKHQSLSNDEEAYRVAAKKLLLAELKHKDDLLKEFLNTFLMKDIGGFGVNPFYSSTSIEDFKKKLEQVIHNLDRGLKPITNDDTKIFNCYMEDFCSFVEQIHKDAKADSSILRQIKDLTDDSISAKNGILCDFTRFKLRLEYVLHCLKSDAPFELGNFMSNCHLLLEYIRDVWLACYFSALLAWPNKSVINATSTVSKAVLVNSKMLNNEVLLDMQAIKADIEILEQLRKEYHEYKYTKGNVAIPVLDMVFQLNKPYSFNITDTNFFSTILKVLYQGKNPPTLD